MNALCRLSIVPIALASVANARGNTITASSGFDLFGADVALGDSTQVFMPVFDTTLGTLNAVTVQVVATEEFGDSLGVQAAPGATLPLPGSSNPVLLSIDFGAFVGWDQIEAGGAPQIYNATDNGYFLTDSTASLSGSFADDPALYLDPNNPQQITVQPYSGFVSQVSGPPVSVFTQGDAGADIFGTLTATFDYTPADPPGDPPGDPPPVPEPSGLALLGVGLLGVGATRLRRQK